jgi:ATP-dependent protease HslVU (ClpYQ) peptidase subunit
VPRGDELLIVDAERVVVEQQPDVLGLGGLGAVEAGAGRGVEEVEGWVDARGLVDRAGLAAGRVVVDGRDVVAQVRELQRDVIAVVGAGRPWAAGGVHVAGGLGGGGLHV